MQINGASPREDLVMEIILFSCLKKLSNTHLLKLIVVSSVKPVSNLENNSHGY